MCALLHLKDDAVCVDKYRVSGPPTASLQMDMMCKVRVCAACICVRVSACDGVKRLVTFRHAMYDSEHSFFL